MNKKLLLTLSALPLLLGSCINKNRIICEGIKLDSNQIITVYDHGQVVGLYRWSNDYGWQNTADSNFTNGQFQTLKYSINLQKSAYKIITVKLSGSIRKDSHGYYCSDQVFEYVGSELSYKVYTKGGDFRFN